MASITRLFLPIILLSLNLNPCFSQIDSVRVSFIEEATDSLGPWTYTTQNIDSMDSAGRLYSRTQRTWNGSNWMNDRTETFNYDNSGHVILHTHFTWNGNSYTGLEKIENTYLVNGKLTTETSYQFNTNNWVPLTKREHSYSQNFNDSLVIYSTYTGSSWNLTDRHVFTFNSNNELIADLWENWNGVSWVKIQLNTHSYSPSLSKIVSDSIFNYSDPYFFPYQSTRYLYNASGNLETKITSDFYSYLYADADTEFVATETEIEYTFNLNHDSNGRIMEEHGYQSKGSFQTMVFENNYFSYDASGNLNSSFSHKGSNIQEYYQRNSVYYYALLEADFATFKTSCTTCNDGSIQVTAKGGVPAYQIRNPLNIGTVQGVHIENLPSGIHTICVSDSLGNEICQNVFVGEDFTSGINMAESGAEFNLTVRSDISGFLVEMNSTQTMDFYLFDTNARIVLQQTITSGFTFIPADELAEGIYFYQANNKSTSKKGMLVYLNSVR